MFQVVRLSADINQEIMLRTCAGRVIVETWRTAIAPVAFKVGHTEADASELLTYSFLTTKWVAVAH